MRLPLQSPVLPMLAKRMDELPSADGWSFEPKWDGFRTILFRDHDEILIQSRDGKPLDRYFPELLAPILQQLPVRCVLDGEIVIATPSGLDFEKLQLRVHPAASRVNLLAKQTPASIVFFDVLAIGEQNLLDEPYATRREKLQAMLAHAEPPLHLTPATSDRELASDWFRRFEGAGLDGIIAKSNELGYQPNKRVMLKIKHERECDCVVGGFRWHKDGEGTAVGSLLLGLYDDAGELNHVGVCASFTKDKRTELTEYLAPWRTNAREGHPWAHGADSPAADSSQRMPGGQSRWSQGKDLSWEPLRPELVVEVAYEHMQGARFRHLAHFRRWRLDKPTAECTYAQLEVVPPHELQQIFTAGR